LCSRATVEAQGFSSATLQRRVTWASAPAAPRLKPVPVSTRYIWALPHSGRVFFRFHFGECALHCLSGPALLQISSLARGGSQAISVLAPPGYYQNTAPELTSPHLDSNSYGAHLVTLDSSRSTRGFLACRSLVASDRWFRDLRPGRLPPDHDRGAPLAAAAPAAD
jgi:hypothetical protein